MGDPELVGFGVLNNWGEAPNLILVAEYFALTGENVVSIVVVHSKMNAASGVVANWTISLKKTRIPVMPCT